MFLIVNLLLFSLILFLYCFNFLIHCLIMLYNFFLFGFFIFFIVSLYYVIYNLFVIIFFKESLKAIPIIQNVIWPKYFCHFLNCDDLSYKKYIATKLFIFAYIFVVLVKIFFCLRCIIYNYFLDKKNNFDVVLAKILHDYKLKKFDVFIFSLISLLDDIIRFFFPSYIIYCNFSIIANFKQFLLSFYNSYNTWTIIMVVLISFLLFVISEILICKLNYLKKLFLNNSCVFGTQNFTLIVKNFSNNNITLNFNIILKKFSSYFFYYGAAYSRMNLFLSYFFISFLCYAFFSILDYLKLIIIKKIFVLNISSKNKIFLGNIALF
jgi:hypothetical protein